MHVYPQPVKDEGEKKERREFRPATVIFGFHPLTPWAHVQIQAQTLCGYITWESWIFCHITILMRIMESAFETLVA